MGPTKREILTEDMAILEDRLSFLQQSVSANDIWEHQLLWELTKFQYDLFDYILSKGEKNNEKVSESNPQSESRKIEVQAVEVCQRRVDEMAAYIQRCQDRRYQQGEIYS